MTTIRLAFVQEFADRHGRVRRYFRRPGFQRIPLPGLPGSAEFMAAYQAALGGPRGPIGVTRTLPGTIDALVVLYYASVEFSTLAPITRSTYRNVIERFRTEHGDKPVAGLKQEHVRAIVRARAATPGAANKMLRTIKMLMRFAIQEGWRTDDPTFTVKKVRLVSADGIHSWTDDEISTYERHHPVGTLARLAFDLLLWTAQRRADVVRMGLQHVSTGPYTPATGVYHWLTVHQQKTGAQLAVPIMPALAASLAATQTSHLCFLTTRAGKPFTAAGFGNWFRERCNEAGLTQCSAHGLRKAATRRFAEAGFTDEEMMAWTGHKTRSQLTVYSRGASQKKGAMAGATKLVGSSESEQIAVKPPEGVVKL